MAEEEKKEEGEEGEKREGNKKNKKLLWWGLGIGGAGLFITILIFFKNSSSSSTQTGYTPVAAGYNPSNPESQDYWPYVMSAPVTTGNVPASTPGNTTQTGTTQTGGSSNTPTPTPTPSPTPTPTPTPTGTGTGQHGNPVVAFVQKLLPSAKGTITGPSASGNKDTNFWVYTTGKGDTVASVTNQVAKWGTDWQHLYQYRNNAQIFNSASVGYNPNASIPTGLKISV